MMDDLDDMFGKLDSLKTMLYEITSCMDERLCDCIEIDIIVYAGVLLTPNQDIRVRNFELKRSEKTIEDAALIYRTGRIERNNGCNCEAL